MGDMRERDPGPVGEKRPLQERVAEAVKMGAQGFLAAEEEARIVDLVMDALDEGYRHACREKDEWEANYIDLAADNRRLLGAVKEARQMVADWAAYASDYFTEKWDLAGDLRRLDEVIESEGQGTRGSTDG